ncbi:Uu.00g108450.m01.CDS01 [Anthostomella pinea]|uniref:Uu.00g108450.m01.CDS01 n=1 Tax=Anthostomella pinea TaxID=933095 RepID=A0AAI8VEJ0_9PEZI|nr:Uu.00g108450.m01.CDS01 [Anthostomella pinea]
MEAQTEVKNTGATPKSKSEAGIAREKRKKQNQKARRKAQAEEVAQGPANEGGRAEPQQIVKNIPAGSEVGRTGPVRRHKKARFAAPVFAADNILRVESASQWKPAALKPGKQLVEFGAAFDVNDSHLKDLASASPAFRSGLRAIYAGGDGAASRTSVTDETLRALVDARVWTNLQHIRLLGSTGGSTNGLTGLVKSPPIQSIIISAKSRDYMSGMSVLPLMQSDSRTLKYLELVNFEVDDSIEQFLPTLTKMIPGLEFVFGTGKNVAVFRNGSVVV